MSEAGFAILVSDWWFGFAMGGIGTGIVLLVFLMVMAEIMGRK